MNTKRLLDKILDKWPAKVVCLIVAIFLYFFHQASLISSKTVVVPLHIIEDGIVMHIGQVPNSVSVVVRAGEETIKAVQANDISASINLNTITETGVYKLPVQITLSENLLAFDPLEVRLKDDSVSIEVDRKAVKYVPILPSVVGEVAHGYEIESISMNPSTVEIAGPESLLKATEQVYTTRINVSNAEINFSTETACQQLNKFFTVNEEESFRAEISIKPRMMERVFEDVEIEVLNLNDKLEIQEGLLPVTIKLSGSMPVLEEYELSKHAIQINLHDVTEPGTYELPLRYLIPSNFMLVEKSNEQLSLTIVRKSEEKPDAVENGAEQ